MSKQDFAGHEFDFGEVDWDQYESHRAPYPNALYKLIFQHHREGGEWDTALDIGAGGGTVTKVLLEHFKQVVSTDASAGYVSQIAKRFSSQEKAGRITCLQRKFGEFNLEQDLPNGQRVDMITAGTCIHFGDPAKLMTQLGGLIRSGGTMAAFSYGSLVLPPGEPIGSLVDSIKDKIMRWFHENVMEIDNTDTTGTGQARYDNVDFDPATWKNVRRITSLPNESVWPSWIKASESRIRHDIERVEIVEDDFIKMEVGYDYFPGHFQSLAPGYDLLSVIGDDLEQLKKLLGDRKVLAKWPLLMVLATRR